MLKKLLASVLALATVATCAYIPAAAATTYETADEFDYAVWQLNNPEAAPEATTDLTVYVVTNWAGQTTLDKTNTDAFKGVKVSENTVDYVKAALAEVYADVKDVCKYDIVVSATASATTYVANVTKSTAVYYYPVHKDVADSKVLLGYYANVNASILADMYANVATPKMADHVFSNWQLDVDTCEITPVYSHIEGEVAKYYYTEVSVSRALETGVKASWLKSGAYYTNNMVGNTITLKLPNNDKANWVTYLNNYIAATGALTLKVAAEDVEDKVATQDVQENMYEYASLRLVGDNAYTVIYKAPAAAAAEADKIYYSLSFTLDGEDYDGFGAYVATDKYTTDAADIYAMLVATDEYKNYVDADTDTLAEALVAADNVKYSIEEYTLQVVNTYDKYVAVAVVLTPAYKYEVYSFANNDAVVKSYAYLTDAQIDSVSYTNKDLNDKFVPATVMAATAADLGVATEATVEGVPAVYAYAELMEEGDYEKTGLVYTTYKMGDATATLADFATTTGAFDEQTYFCRDARAGDPVTLKVSLSAQGEAKGYDVTKITVEWNTIGCTAGENYAFAATELYKAGCASQITLAEGTNIVTATVYYNGVKVGTFAPFYAAV